MSKAVEQAPSAAPSLAIALLAHMALAALWAEQGAADGADRAITSAAIVAVAMMMLIRFAVGTVILAIAGTLLIVG
jgi:hypothetical protein